MSTARDLSPSILPHRRLKTTLTSCESTTVVVGRGLCPRSLRPLKKTTTPQKTPTRYCLTKLERCSREQTVLATPDACHHQHPYISLSGDRESTAHSLYSATIRTNIEKLFETAPFTRQKMDHHSLECRNMDESLNAAVLRPHGHLSST